MASLPVRVASQAAVREQNGRWINSRIKFDARLSPNLISTMTYYRAAFLHSSEVVRVFNDTSRGERGRIRDLRCIRGLHWRMAVRVVAPAAIDRSDRCGTRASGAARVTNLLAIRRERLQGSRYGLG